jgi:ferredoxin
MAFTVRIDKNSCQSSGNCVEAAEAGFGFDEDGLGEVLAGAAQLPRARLLEIARRCPALAIGVFDEAGNELEPGS